MNPDFPSLRISSTWAHRATGNINHILLKNACQIYDFEYFLQCNQCITIMQYEKLGSVRNKNKHISNYIYTPHAVKALGFNMSVNATYNNHILHSIFQFQQEVIPFFALRILPNLWASCLLEPPWAEIWIRTLASGKSKEVSATWKDETIQLNDDRIYINRYN